jgi:sortase B
MKRIKKLLILVFSLILIFSTYKIIKWYIENKYRDYLNSIKNKSIIKLNVDVNENDRIITLYTCSKTDDRTILHAKLIQEKKY